MSESLEPFVGYVDGASHSTQNLSFAVWAIFTLNGELVSFQGICIVRSKKNIDEYSALIELISDVISFGINCIIIKLDSQLVVCNLLVFILLEIQHCIVCSREFEFWKDILILFNINTFP